MHRLHQQYMKDWTLLLQWLLVVLKEQEEWDRVQEQVQEVCEQAWREEDIAWAEAQDQVLREH